MSDLISRQTAIDAVQGIGRLATLQDNDAVVRMSAVEYVLFNLPSVQPEQKIGKFVRWMEKRETPDYISYTPHCKCSLCGNELLIESINYCYMCGARLIEDREAEGRKE